MEKEKLMEEISLSYSLVKEYENSIDRYEEKMKSYAFSLLEELRKIDGWENMMESCQWHYEKYPDQFFSWCEPIVYGTTEKPCLMFKKGYSNDDDYIVLRIDLTKPLEEQVKEKVMELESEKRKKDSLKKKKEYEEYLRLRKKFEKDEG